MPIAQTWLLVGRPRAPAPAEGPPLPKPLVVYLWIQGPFLFSAAPVLLLHPYDGALLWPWPVQHMLAQIYGAPLFAYGVGLLLAARSARWAEMLMPLALGPALVFQLVRFGDQVDAGDPALLVTVVDLLVLSAAAIWMWLRYLRVPQLATIGIG